VYNNDWYSVVMQRTVVSDDHQLISLSFTPRGITTPETAATKEVKNGKEERTQNCSW